MIFKQTEGAGKEFAIGRQEWREGVLEGGCRQLDYYYNFIPMKFLTAIILLFAAVTSHAQNPENWTSNQLIEPADLAKDLKANKDLPIVISVGPGAVIPNSINVGMVNNAEGLSKLKDQLSSLPKQTNIVVYCGCCPFNHCPNVRPAIDVLKEMKFTNYHLLNLPHNIKTDWIDKGFPTAAP